MYPASPSHSLNPPSPWSGLPLAHPWLFHTPSFRIQLAKGSPCVLQMHSTNIPAKAQPLYQEPWFPAWPHNPTVSCCEQDLGLSHY